MSRTHQHSLALSLALASTLPLVTCDKAKEEPAPATSTSTSAVAASTPQKPALDTAVLAAFAPIAKPAAPDKPELFALGRMLYFDARLSKNHDHSCNSCHRLDAFGVDGQPTSEGHKKQHGDRNSPTVLNASLHFRQFWDGRAADVEEQATGPIQNPVEMASDEKRVVATLSSMKEYVDAFAKAFPGVDKPVTLKNVGVAIGAFERQLVTPSKWDRYLGGDKGALTDAELAGAVLFAKTGCTACHSGAAVGGAMYQKAGLVKPWPSDKDLGRYRVTKQDADKMLFKVPSLRNIEKTGPYFHDGGTAKLEDAIRTMARHQLGKELSDDEVTSIVTFLKTLTAPPPADLVAPPALPKSTPKTPAPDPA